MILLDFEKTERKKTPNAAQQDVAINPTMARPSEKREGLRILMKRDNEVGEHGDPV